MDQVCWHSRLCNFKWFKKCRNSSSVMKPCSTDKESIAEEHLNYKVASVREKELQDRRKFRKLIRTFATCLRKEKAQRSFQKAC